MSKGKIINATLKGIIALYLREHGFDGLYNDECGCAIDDLFSCSFPAEDCRAGYRGPCDCGDCDCHFGPEKEPDDAE